MQTLFTEHQLSSPPIREANRILRHCVHCGFCLATCPTYQLLGDELDSPRGRIYLIKDMLENERNPSDEVVKHIDRCLSCLSCMTTCPSNVNYMHLVDRGRAYIEEHHRRPAPDRFVRALLAGILPRAKFFRWALQLARAVEPLQRFLPQRIRAMTTLAKSVTVHQYNETSQSLFPAVGEIKGRVGLLSGCVQTVMGNDINQATISLLTRLGYEVWILEREPCCGAIEQHLGKESRTRKRITENVKNWKVLMKEQRIEAIIVNASGCGTMIKDYAYLLRENASLSGAATFISQHTLDITEFLDTCDLTPLSFRTDNDFTIACHNPCSMQHGQNITEQPAALLRRFGFRVTHVPEAHMCCGSAGTYNLLQPELANRLGQHKAQQIRSLQAHIVATGNLGCIAQMRRYLDVPVRHTTELLDWASYGQSTLNINDIDSH
ncbi:MAG: glycolate oxidase subunit GlcF [Gammaproteobacteria bacterium]